MKITKYTNLYRALIVVCLLNAYPLITKASLQRGALDGRWDLTFDIPERQYRTIIEFNTSDDGKVSAATLGYPLLTFTEGRLTENKLRLKGTSPYGAVEVNATLDGSRLVGRWQVAFLSGEVHGSHESANRAAVSHLAIFDEVWTTVNKHFYDPHFNGIDWQSARARYRPQAEAAHSDGELTTIIRNMLGELHSSHLSFSALTIEQSFSTLKSNTSGATPMTPITWRKLSPEVGYIQIKQFEESLQIIYLVDRAFAEIGALPSLIIDVRGNPGGTLSAAMRLGDYLFTKMRPVGYFATRAGLARFKSKSIEQLKPAALPSYSGYNVLDFRRELEHSGAVMITTGGRAKPYRGRIVLLIDKGCGSTTEGFASVVKETHAATLIGRRTAGAMLSSVEKAIAGGWTLRFPEADFRTPGGVQVEGRGVEPDIVVQPEPPGDADLNRALSFLGRQKG